jgi:uncharacterized protein involved in exopolysaccharide biosynthesis
MVFRRGRLIVVWFFTIFASVLLATWMMPAQYESEAKILVKRGAVHATASVNTKMQSQPELTQQELNSEVELLKSRDLLEKVVLASGFDARSGKTHISQLVRHLEKTLNVEHLRQTNLIKLTYQSSDPKLSVRILQTLVDLYLQKHLEVYEQILNVSVVQVPTMSDIPSSPNWPLNLLLGSLLAGFVGIGIALRADYLDRSFRTPKGVEAFLGIPVLASFPFKPDTARRQPAVKKAEQTLEASGINLLERCRIKERSHNYLERSVRNATPHH